MGQPLVDYRAEGGIAFLTLNDPPANTYTYEMMQELDQAILRVRMDDAVHVLVLSGHGEKFFCAGANIQMLATATPAFPRTPSGCLSRARPARASVHGWPTASRSTSSARATTTSARASPGAS